jgi:enoyl-CoA hydratase
MTTPQLLTYELADSIATITMDDGKANVMSAAMLGALHAAFERAAREARVVVLTGRKGMFSAGYDLAMFRSSPDEIRTTLRAGGELVHRILGFPVPVVMACPGHAVAQGAFLLLSADVRIGVTGERKIGLNEVVIGLTIPFYGVEVARQRLSPAHFNHATVTGAFYPPEGALAAGFFDRVVAPDELADAALAEARRLLGLNLPAHEATKLRVRAPALAAIRAGIDAEFPATVG